MFHHITSIHTFTKHLGLLWAPSLDWVTLWVSRPWFWEKCYEWNHRIHTYYISQKVVLLQFVQYHFHVLLWFHSLLSQASLNGPWRTPYLSQSYFCKPCPVLTQLTPFKVRTCLSNYFFCPCFVNVVNKPCLCYFVFFVLFQLSWNSSWSG